MGVVGQNSEDYVSELSGRQKEVAELIALGFSNGQIALRLDIEKRTVERHMAMICFKLDLSGITDKVSARVMIARYIIFGERVHPFDHNKRIKIHKIKQTFEMNKIKEEHTVI